MSPNRPVRSCPECREDAADAVSRRSFLAAGGVVAAAAATSGLWLPATARATDESKAATPETLVKTLYESLKENQKKEICFDWD